ncbi:CocE/NonD family hydrolase [Planctomycetota bacterium]
METKYQTYLIAKIVLVTSLCSILAGSETEELGVKIERNVPVPMRDGIILRADVHRPNRGGPYPVLIKRTPYGKGGNFDRFVKAGYIVVSQDARGRGKSEGEYDMNFKGTYEAEDGYDTIEWAAKIPGSNGKVGTFGISLPAFLQWRLAPLRPNSLLAMSAWSIPAGRSIGTGSAVRFPGFRLQWWDRMATDMRRKANLPGIHIGWERFKLWSMGDSVKWINWLPWNELPNDFFGYPADAAYSFTALRKDSKPWNLHKGCKNISVPNLDVVGWYDHANGDMLLFRTMVEEARTEVARKGSRIIIGPWDHMSLGGRGSGNIDFGPDAAFDIRGVQVRWFDYWLKGKQNGVDKEAPVKIFVMGDNKWRDEQHWPLQRTKEKILFTTSNGQANTPSGNGKLADERPQSLGIDNYAYDPRDPVPTPYKGRPKAADWRPLDSRQDILVYQSEPLTERTEITGNPVVELYAASSAPDTDWFVRLIDVAPDGLARDVSYAMIRARYRDGPDRPKLIKPHEVVRYAIRMRPTSNAFLPRHRIRLDITSSDFPVIDRNHNTAADQNADATLVTARQKIYHGGEQATRIILPCVPNPTEAERPSEDKPKPEPQKQMYPLHQAAAEGDIEKVKLAISQGVDVDAEGELGKTLLHYAAETGKLEVVQLLVKLGADVNAITANDWSVLSIAVANDHAAVVEHMIAHGADVDAGLLHFAVTRGRRRAAEILIQNEADINLNSKNDGLTPLHEAAANGMPSFVTLLLSKGVEVDQRDDIYEFTALHYAARFGCKDVAEVLIANGANIKAKDKWDYQPIHWAAYHDRVDVVELLISKGADVNAKTSLGQTPLQLAKPRRNTVAIEVLHKHGAKE